RSQLQRGRGRRHPHRDVSIGRVQLCAGSAGLGRGIVFAAWGRFVYRYRWATLVGSGVLLAFSIAGLAMGGTLQSGGPLTSNLESAQASRLLNSDLSSGGGPTTPMSTFDFIYKSNTLMVGDPAYKDAVTASLQPIHLDPRINSLISPYVVPPSSAQSLTSKDGHEALVLVQVLGTGQQALNTYTDLRSKVHSSTLTITGTGFVPVNHAFNTTLETDLQRAELVTLPVTLVLLVLIFAGLVAAGLPMGVGVLTILGGIGGTFFLNRFTDVSQYALNIVTLIGLGVSIDYSLFIVNRFRDELAKGVSREDAVATTIATAGRAITFSGLTVAVGLSAMLFFQIRLANGSVDELPTHVEARQGYDRLVADFAGQDQTTFNIVVSYPDGSPLTANRIADQYSLDRRIVAIPGVLHTTSIY